MKGYLTSYVGVFQTDRVPVVSRIEIPLIQRDYAQGRPDEHASGVRHAFLTALIDALVADEELGLDFVYGNVENGTFQPLDGQQRLTTLFLLHWYLASVTGKFNGEATWAAFTYETRPSARRFCVRLAEHALPHPLPPAATTPSDWITDQAWYLYRWRHDPTIQAMLVMIDAIAAKLDDRGEAFDAERAWKRLTDPVSPAVSFYLLPLNDLISGDELYIKMNSRGKPLTPFENFKARFERTIEHSSRAKEFAMKVDGAWADLLWPIHGGDNIVDEELMRYIDFITEICEFREYDKPRKGERATTGLGQRAETIFGATNPRAATHLDFLFASFDSWPDIQHVNDTFASLFSTASPGDAAYDPGKVTHFGTAQPNLFEQCCHHFSSSLTRRQAFSLQQSLLLHAVLVHVTRKTDDAATRLRMVRNLVTASEDEIRYEAMPGLLRDVEVIMESGDLDTVRSLSQRQVEDEKAKRELLRQFPDLGDVLARLEDHDLLRGSLGAFELDPSLLRDRAASFEVLFTDSSRWPALTGAMLATGEYQRQRRRSTAWQFGTSNPQRDGIWRYVFTDGSREELTAARDVLGDLLDGYAASGLSVDDFLDTTIHDWLAEQAETRRLDWRYYLVRYPSMREGATGIYYAVGEELGYDMCMLRTVQRNGRYRDPFLFSIWQHSAVSEAVEDPWFTGYEWTPRWMRLTRSGTGIRSIAAGLALERPETERAAGVFDTVVANRTDIVQDGEHLLLKIPQRDHDGVPIDTEDRIELGAALVESLVAEGL